MSVKYKFHQLCFCYKIFDQVAKGSNILPARVNRVVETNN